MAIINDIQIGVVSNDGCLYIINTTNPNKLQIDGKIKFDSTGYCLTKYSNRLLIASTYTSNP